MLARQQRGVTLIELMVGITIIAILLVVGMPSFGQWIQNTQTRTAAESVLNGLQTARNEAVRRNANVRFSLTDTAGSVAWTIGCAQVSTVCPDVIQSRMGTDAAPNARVGASTAVIPTSDLATYFGTSLAAGIGLPASVTFNGVGTIPPANIGTDITRIDITNSASSFVRRLVIIIGAGGAVRICDPLLSLANNPQGCY